VVNIGHRAGAAVAQLYLAAHSATVPRPVKELKGFTRMELAAGERRRVELVLERNAFAYYSVEHHAFHVEPGEFEVMIGASVEDIRLSARFTVPR
jgi:beta-glucosidase